MRLIDNLSILRLDEYVQLSREWDVFICCGSFEDRSTRTTQVLSGGRVRIDTSIVLDYKEVDPEGRKHHNLEEIEHRLSELSRRAHRVSAAGFSRPSEGVKGLVLFLESEGIELTGKSILVDITVLTKPYFFLLFRVLRDKYHVDDIYVAYSEPEKYRSPNSHAREIILTEGLDRIESIPGFVGSSLAASDALVALLGFEGRRLLDVFDALNPELTYVINGFPSFQPGWHKISLEANLRFIEQSASADNLYFAPAVDPFETKNVLCHVVSEIRDTHPGLNVVVAPLGTKMQALGVLLCALHDRAMKVVYPFPSSYRPDYSYSYGPTWVVKPNLSQP